MLFDTNYKFTCPRTGPLPRRAKEIRLKALLVNILVLAVLGKQQFPLMVCAFQKEGRDRRSASYMGVAALSSKDFATLSVL